MNHYHYLPFEDRLMILTFMISCVKRNEIFP